MKIPEIPLRPELNTDEARQAAGFKWADDGVGNRSKFGGAPDFLQAEEAPTCTSCDQPMSFYAQLDSIGDDICLADAGMIFVFVCLDCFTTQSLLQSG